jgi:hypothetical protein
MVIVPSHRYVPRLPPQARPLTLTEMKVICDQLPSFDAQLGVDKVEAIDMMTLQEFQVIIHFTHSLHC